MKTGRGTIEALMSVCPILWVVGWLLFFDGEAEARRRHGGATNPSSISQPQDSGTAEVGPQVEALLKRLQKPDMDMDMRDLLKQLQEPVRQEGGNQESANQEAVTQEAILRGQVLRVEDADGVVYYTNKPCDLRYVRSPEDPRCDGTR